MAFKHQTKSYRTIMGERWVCWCDGLQAAEQIAADIRAKGFKARREGDRVFVLASELTAIERASA